VLPWLFTYLNRFYFDTNLFTTDRMKQTTFMTHHVHNRPIMNVACYERSVMNVVCY